MLRVDLLMTEPGRNCLGRLNGLLRLFGHSVYVHGYPSPFDCFPGKTNCARLSESFKRDPHSAPFPPAAANEPSGPIIIVDRVVFSTTFAILRFFYEFCIDHVPIRLWRSSLTRGPLLGG